MPHAKVKKTVSSGQVSPTAVWVQGFEPRALGFVASTLVTLWAILLAHTCIFKFSLLNSQQNQSSKNGMGCIHTLGGSVVGPDVESSNLLGQEPVKC